MRNLAYWTTPPTYAVAGRRPATTSRPGREVHEAVVPESEVAVLPDVAGRGRREIGCGTAYISAWLARPRRSPGRRARPDAGAARHRPPAAGRDRAAVPARARRLGEPSGRRPFDWPLRVRRRHLGRPVPVAPGGRSCAPSASWSSSPTPSSSCSCAPARRRPGRHRPSCGTRPACTASSTPTTTASSSTSRTARCCACCAGRVRGPRPRRAARPRRRARQHYIPAAWATRVPDARRSGAARKRGDGRRCPGPSTGATRGRGARAPREVARRDDGRSARIVEVEAYPASTTRESRLPGPTRATPPCSVRRAPLRVLHLRHALVRQRRCGDRGRGRPCCCGRRRPSTASTLMRAGRPRRAATGPANGPAKLCQAFGLDRPSTAPTSSPAIGAWRSWTTAPRHRRCRGWAPASASASGVEHPVALVRSHSEVHVSGLRPSPSRSPGASEGRGTIVATLTDPRAPTSTRTTERPRPGTEHEPCRSTAEDEVGGGPQAGPDVSGRRVAGSVDDEAVDAAARNASSASASRRRRG